jgi:hypothetical protein
MCACGDATSLGSTNIVIMQVEELAEKVAAGAITPTPEQQDKLARREALCRELAEVWGVCACVCLCACVCVRACVRV